MTLRIATSDDSGLLLAWRNDPITRIASHSGEAISVSMHKTWLESTLSNPDRQLYIAEENGASVGTVRADYCNGEHEISWTVAAESRGRGIAKRMVRLLADHISGPLRAEVKSDNLASARVAEFVGMLFEFECDGIKHYVRPATVKNHN